MTDPASWPSRGIGWAFLFALHRESAPFTRQLRFVQTLPDSPCPAALYDTRRKAAVVLETGIGAERAAAAVRWVLNKHRPQLVFACGFAGALSPRLKIGDVLLASEVIEPGDDELRWRTAVPGALGDLEVGRLLTVPRLLAKPADKRSFASRTKATMVDMESAAIAEACQQVRVPCAVVRAISDTAATELSPRLVSLLSGGRISPWRVLTAVARSPRIVVEMWRLARDTRIAALALADALGRLVR